MLCAGPADGVEDEAVGSIVDPPRRPARFADGETETPRELSSALQGLQLSGGAGKAEAEEDDGAIPDIDDVEGEDLMMEEPKGEEDDAAALPSSVKAETGPGKASPYLKAEEPEDNIVKTSDDLGCSRTPHCSSHH